jgi:hypothetical protein
MLEETNMKMLLQYLKEWKEEKALAQREGSNPRFSWDRHDKELISIQGAVRSEWNKLDDSQKASLSKENRNLVNLILRAKID